MKKNLALLLPAALAGGSAFAHDGHGAASGVHWHATDVFGFVALALVIGLVAWWMGRK